MKKLVSIFLLVILVISHLNIIDTFTGIKTAYKENLTRNQIPIEEEHHSEKDGEGKSKKEEGKILFSLVSLGNLLSQDQGLYFSYHTPLNLDPYQEFDIQPPKVAS